MWLKVQLLNALGAFKNVHTYKDVHKLLISIVIKVTLNQNDWSSFVSTSTS